MARVVIQIRETLAITKNRSSMLSLCLARHNDGITVVSYQFLVWILVVFNNGEFLHLLCLINEEGRHGVWPVHHYPQ